MLRATAKSAAKQVAKAVKSHQKMRKDDTDDDAAATEVAVDLDLTEMSILIDFVPDSLEPLGSDAGARALFQVGITDRGDLVNQVFDESVDYSKQRAAEMVGKKYVGGVLVDNQDAAWSIPSATRSELRAIIAEAFAGNIDPADVENAIAEAGAFSPERAALIARTEISRANNFGALSGYITARDQTGLDIKKAWHPDFEACPICLANEMDGIIALDDEFSSGDLAPPAHPNCECSVVPITDGN